MISVLLLQLVRMKRSPILVLSFLVLTILFVGVMAGFGASSDETETIYVYSEIDATPWLELLNESDDFQFEVITKQEAQTQVKTGELNYALEIQNNNYQFLIGTEDPDQISVEQYVNRTFEKERKLRQISRVTGEESIREQIETELANPTLSISTEAVNSSNYSNADLSRYQILIGMTLYFAIYTIFYHLINIVVEKQTGTWNRLILSPIQKWQMYVGHLFYCFLIGFLQIGVVFFIFSFLGYDLGAQWGPVIVAIASYVFAIVSLGMLIMGVATTPQQLQAINPIVATGMAMLGGAFWPIEAVSNSFMVALSKGMPIMYGMEALKATMLYQQGFSAILEPVSILLLFGVISMGVGINLMERVKH